MAEQPVPVQKPSTKSGAKDSIERKLRSVLLTVSLLSILLTCSGFILYEIFTYPGKFIASLRSTGGIIAANSTAALAFDNRQDAADVLGAMKLNPRITSAAIYDAHGALFVSYRRDSIHTNIPLHASADGAVLSGGRIEIFMPIKLREKRTGTLYLAADLEGIYSRLRSYGIIAFIVVIGVFLIAAAIASRLQRKISTPILELSGAARQVTEFKDYSIRVPGPAWGNSGNEISVLSEAFNLMLSQIAERDTTLRAANDSLIQEVREREKAEQIISASEKRFRHLFASHPLPMWVYDLDTLHFLEVNESAISKYGYSRDQFLGMRITDIRPSADLPRLIENLSKHRQVQEFAGVWRHSLKDGTIIDVEIISHTTEFDGQPAALVVAIDVTERRKAERLVAVSEERYRSLVSTMSSVVWNADPAGMFTHAQDSWQRYTGQPRVAYTGSGWLDAIHPDDRNGVVKQWVAAVESRSSFFAEGRIRHVETSSYRHCEMRAVPLVESDGMLREWIGTLTDVHDKKLAQEEIRLLNAGLERRVKERTIQLELANKELEAFSYSVSHDLRAPLRGINGFSQLLLEDYAEQLDEQAKGYINRVRTSTLKMSTLIDDLLNLAKVSRAELTRQEVDLSDLVRQIIADLRNAEPERDVEFRFTSGTIAEADSHLLRVVMENLLNNAWKYSSKKPHATIEFGVLTQDGQTVYFVRDDGTGFDMNYASQLFRPFQRLHTAAEFSGTGIGLATVYRIIQRHGGRIWAEGKPGEGATFYFTLQP